MADKEKEQGYFPALAAAAPVFGLKAVVGDMPKGAVEYAVEQKTLGSKKHFGANIRQGFKGRGAGRALGAALGIATAPLFLKGTRLLSSKDDAERRKGYALVAGSTAALASAKGFLESAGQALAAGKNPAAAAASGGLTAGVRATYKIPMALATAAGIAAGRSKAESSPGMKYVMPVAAGAGAGAVSRAIEEAAQMAATDKKLLRSAAGVRRITAAGAGGAAGGVLGGLVLAKAVDLLSPKEKKASVLDLLGHVAGTAVKEVVHGYPVAVGQHAITGAGYGYKSQAGLLRKIIGAKNIAKLQKTTNRARSRQMGLGIQEGLYGYSTAPFGAKMIANAGLGIGGMSPESTAYRELGIKLGRSLRDLPPEARVTQLKRMQKFILDRPDTLRGPEGELNPLTGPLLGGISMAIGERGFYDKGGKLKELGKHMLHGGHPYSEKGLPTQLGDLEKEPGWLKANYPHLLSLTGLAAGTALAPLGVAGVAAGSMGGHTAFSGIKNLVSSTPLVKEKIIKSTHAGIRYGMFPNKAFEPTKAMEYGLSPATTMMERSLKPIVRGVRDEEIAKGIGAVRQRFLVKKDGSKAKRILKGAPMALAAPIAAGTGLGLVGSRLVATKKAD